MNPLVAVAVAGERCSELTQKEGRLGRKRGKFPPLLSSSNNLWHCPADQNARRLWTRDRLSSLPMFFSPHQFFVRALRN